MLTYLHIGFHINPKLLNGSVCVYIYVYLLVIVANKFNLKKEIVVRVLDIEFIGVGFVYFYEDVLKA